MKKILPLLSLAFFLSILGEAQVTQINNNQSLEPLTPLNATLALFRSDIDGHLWASQGTPGTTVKINNTISADSGGALLNGKYIFSGNNPTTGSELYITDGTAPGTQLLKEIIAGNPGSNPNDFTEFNGHVYFSAGTAETGREIWRTDGTANGTVLIKDINSGPGSSNSGGEYNFTPAGNILFFTASSGSPGNELWKTNGTAEGTVQVKDIEPGDGSSNPSFMWPLGNVLLFIARTAANGNEVWRSDGTEAGTFLLKDIIPGPVSSTEFEILPGFSFPITMGFHLFENRAFFVASDGVNYGNIYETDGTTANTKLLKTVISGTSFPLMPMVFSINLPGKFFFSVSDADSRAEIWQSDGTPGGTTLFKSFFASEDNPTPLLFKTFGDQMLTGGPDALFQGTTFFMAGPTEAEGMELWKSDGTLQGTELVKNINPGNADGIDTASLFSYLYSTAGLFFAATDGTTGVELWRSDGTSNGTTLVKDIRLNAPGSNPVLWFIHNNKIFFSAQDGDDLTQTDLFVVDGSFTPLPAHLATFTVVRTGADVQVQWKTLSETNTDMFLVERSSDGRSFSTIGTQKASGNSRTENAYSFTDVKPAFPQGGRLYYRLVTADKDSKKSFSRVVAIAGLSTGWDARLLNNTPGLPVQMAFEGAANGVSVQVTDMNGRVMLQRRYEVNTGPVTLPVHGLSKGTYNITISNGSEVKTFRYIR